MLYILVVLWLGAFSVSLFSGVQVLYILDKGINANELGWIFSATVVGFLSLDLFFSYIFDNTSRRLSVCLGHLCVSIFALLMMFANTVVGLIIAGLFVGIANALFTGSLFAMIIENIKDKSQMQKVILETNMIGFSGVIVGIVVGTTIASIFSFATTYMTVCLLNLVMCPFSFLALPQNKTVAKFSWQKLKQDFSKVSNIYFSKNIRSVSYLNIVASILSASIVSFWAYFIFDKTSLQQDIFIVSGIIILFRILDTLYSYILKKISLYNGLYVTSFFIVLAILCFISFMLYQQKVVFIVAIVCIYIGMKIKDSVIAIHFQKKITDDLRSTASSFFGSIKSIVEIACLPLIGWLFQVYNHSSLLAIYFLGLLIAIYFLVKFKKGGLLL